MAEIRCEECGSIIPNGAKACPNCGCPQREKTTTSSFWQKLCKHIYTKDEDPYVDLAAKLTAVPKVLVAVLYIGFVPLHMVLLVLLGGSVFTFVELVQIFAFTLMFGGAYIFWWWVGNIIVKGIRKIRQSKNKQ